MEKRKMVVVCAVVGLSGLISAATGFAAEATRVKASDVRATSLDTCVYPPSNSALALGLTAAVALAIAQAIINTIAGCICCKKRQHAQDTNWKVAVISFVISWITFVIAFLLLLSGAALNDQRGEEGRYFDNCYVAKPGVFAGGALLSLASVSLGIVYYIALSKSKAVQSRGGGTQPNNQGIAMGQPVIPPQSNQPVFVHEDTYNRRQFP